MATNHASSQTSKCNTPSPTSSEHSFSDYGSARRLTRKADRVNTKKDNDKSEDGDDFRLDLDFDRDDDKDDTQGILVQEPHQEHVDKANDVLDTILDLDFDRVEQHDTREVNVQWTCQVTPFHENDVHELDIEFDAHENHDDKQALEPTSSVKFGDEEKALDEWGFDEAILLRSIEPNVNIVPNDILTISSDHNSNDDSDEEDDVSKCVSEDSDQSSDAPCFESSQELNESNYVHSQVPNFAPSNSKRISKPPCDRFVSYTTKSMIDDDDDEDDDVGDIDANDDHEDDDDDDDDDDNNEDDDNDDEDDDDEDVDYFNDDDDHVEEGEEEDEEHVQRWRSFKRKRT